MKKLILSLTIASIALGSFAQSCSPDATITNPGTYPNQLPAGTSGAYYEEVVQFNIPADTNVQFSGTTVNAVIDSIKVTSLMGLPPGLNYGCNPSTCALPGGKTSCGVIYGDIDGSASGTYNFVVPIIIYARIGGAFPLQQPDTLFYLSMDVNAPNSAKTIVPNTLMAYPNPAGNTLHVTLAHSAAESTIKVYDGQGKEIELPFTTQYNRIDLQTETLSKGIYYGVVQDGANTHRFKFVKS